MAVPRVKLSEYASASRSRQRFAAQAVPRPADDEADGVDEQRRAAEECEWQDPQQLPQAERPAASPDAQHDSERAPYPQCEHGAECDDDEPFGDAHGVSKSTSLLSFSS